MVFIIEDSTWTLDLREGKGKIYQGKPETKSDLEVKATEENFVKLVMGEISAQQVMTQFLVSTIQ